jgi:hypothetical protein
MIGLSSWCPLFRTSYSNLTGFGHNFLWCRLKWSLEGLRNHQQFREGGVQKRTGIRETGQPAAWPEYRIWGYFIGGGLLEQLGAQLIFGR